MTSEGSCDTEDWGNDAENSAFIQHIQIENTLILNYKISQNYSFFIKFYFFSCKCFMISCLYEMVGLCAWLKIKRAHPHVLVM